MRQEIWDSGRSIHEIIIVASMIEKETDGTDRANIASVIYNRLNNPSAGTQGYLQIDATLAYINGGKVPTEADKSIDSPYNTYLYKGLPAGPCFCFLPPPPFFFPKKKNWGGGLSLIFF